LIAGFVAAMTGDEIALSWRRVFQLSWIVGFCGGSLVYYLISLVFPPPGAPYVRELLDTEVIEGSNGSDEETGVSSDVAEKK
jgi:nucleobase:cation symporter-1, NCS1 family